jgi:anti-sigma factor RsiW
MAQTLSRDELLTGYLDGALDAEQTATVEALLASDPDARQRLETLSKATVGLPDAADALLAEAPAMPSLPAPRDRLRHLGWAASLAIGLVMGGLLATAFKDNALTDWRDFAASYHALYTTETLANVSASPATAQQQLQDVGDAIGRDLTPAAEVDGLEFRRAQLLGFQDQVIVQLAYLTPSGIPVALCIMSGGATTKQIARADRQGVPSVSWSQGSDEFLLLGQPGLDDLRPLAEEFATKL